MKWKCSDPECNHIWPAQPSARTGTNETGCPDCAEYGIKKHLPTTLYVVANDMWLKAGIANDHALEGRLGKHQNKKQNNMDQVLHLIPFDVGYDADDVEKIWKEEFLPTFPDDMRPSKDDVPDGFTESVRNLEEVRQWIEENFVPLAEAS